MGLVQNLRNRIQINAGRARASYGRATGNRSLQVKARRQRIVGATRQVGQPLKESGRNIRAALKLARGPERVSYADMAIRSRPASEAPASVIERLAEKADIAIPGDEDTRGNRLAGARALAGIGTLAHPAPGTRAGRRPPRPARTPPPPGRLPVLAGGHGAAGGSAFA